MHSLPTHFLVLMPAGIVAKLHIIIWSCISLLVFSYNFLQGHLIGNYFTGWTYFRGAIFSRGNLSGHRHIIQGHLVGNRWLGVPFPKLKIFSGIFWAQHIEYSPYKKTIVGIFVYLFIYEVTIWLEKWYSAVLLVTSGKEMSNNCTPCFNRIYFIFIPSYIKHLWWIVPESLI